MSDEDIDLFEAGIGLINKNDLEPALKIFQDIEDRHYSPRASCFIGQILYKNGQYDKALDVFNAVYKREELDLFIKKLIDKKFAFTTEALNEVDKWKKSIKKGSDGPYENFIVNDKEITYLHNTFVEDLLFSRAMTFRRLGRIVDANDSFEKAITVREINAENLYNQAIGYFSKGDMKKTKETLAKSLEINKFFLKSLKKFAEINITEGRNQIAVEQLTRIINIDQSSDWAWCNLGFAYMKLKAVEHALEAFSKAVEINPKNRKAWFFKISLLIVNHRCKEAEQTFNQLYDYT